MFCVFFGGGVVVGFFAAIEPKWNSESSPKDLFINRYKYNKIVIYNNIIIIKILLFSHMSITP